MRQRLNTASRIHSKKIKVTYVYNKFQDKRDALVENSGSRWDLESLQNENHKQWSIMTVRGQLKDIEERRIYNFTHQEGRFTPGHYLTRRGRISFRKFHEDDRKLA